MSQQILMLEVVKKLLQDDNKIKLGELPTIICSLLRPFVNRAKPSKELDRLVANMLQSYGICSRCRANTLKYATDLFCGSCKSILKDRAKAILE